MIASLQQMTSQNDAALRKLQVVERRLQEQDLSIKNQCQNASKLASGKVKHVFSYGKHPSYYHSFKKFEFALPCSQFYVDVCVRGKLQSLLNFKASYSRARK